MHWYLISCVLAFTIFPKKINGKEPSVNRGSDGSTYHNKKLVRLAICEKKALNLGKRNNLYPTLTILSSEEWSRIIKFQIFIQTLTEGMTHNCFTFSQF